MTIIEADFDEKKNEGRMREAGLTIETDEAKPLRMEHFHLPLGMLMVGILISLLFFIAEIIKHRYGGY